MGRLKKSKSTEKIGAQYKGVDSFLYPSMPGSFAPFKIRRLHIDLLRDRYLQVFSASMGNHSLSRFYCCWSQEQYEAAVNPAFSARIMSARAELADRAALIMYKGMGLVAGEGPMAPPTVTAAMAKVVESMTNPDGTKGLQKKAYKLTVNGLQRPPVQPLAVKRGRGRPRIGAPAEIPVPPPDLGPVGPTEETEELP